MHGLFMPTTQNKCDKDHIDTQSIGRTLRLSLTSNNMSTKTQIKIILHDYLSLLIRTYPYAFCELPNQGSSFVLNIGTKNYE